MERPERPGRSHRRLSNVTSSQPLINEESREIVRPVQEDYHDRTAPSSGVQQNNGVLVQLLGFKHPNSIVHKDGPAGRPQRITYRRNSQEGIKKRRTEEMAPNLDVSEDSNPNEMGGGQSSTEVKSPTASLENLPMPRPTQVEDVMRNILSMMECPVCFEYITPPIPQCEQGHLICSPCFSKLTVCPKCRSRFTEARNRAMEKIADVIPYPCRNVASGCPEMIFLRNKTRHEQSCGYRQYLCLDQACNWRGYKPELISHMTHEHPRATLVTSDQRIVVSLVPNDQSSWLLFIFDEVFHITFLMDMRKRALLGFVMYIGDSEKALDYVYTLSIERETEPFTRCTYQRTTHCEAPLPTILQDHHLLFCIPSENIQAYLDTALQSTREIVIRVCVEERPTAAGPDEGTVDAAGAQEAQQIPCADGSPTQAEPASLSPC